MNRIVVTISVLVEGLIYPKILTEMIVRTIGRIRIQIQQHQQDNTNTTIRILKQYRAVLEVLISQKFKDLLQFRVITHQALKVIKAIIRKLELILRNFQRISFHLKVIAKF